MCRCWEPPGGDPPGRGTRRVRAGAADASLPAPKHGMARSVLAEAEAIAAEIGYPVLVRPSYVLGGRGMEIVYDIRPCWPPTSSAPPRPARTPGARRPVPRRRDRDRRRRFVRREELFLGGVMEHIEEAGIHSGDSACALPPMTLGRHELEQIRASTPPSRKVSGAWAAQHPVRADPGQTVRPGGQPARVADRALRVEGDRRAAGQSRGPDRRRAEHRASCAPMACCRPPATRRNCRWVRRCRSKKRSCRSAVSTAWTVCSARKCVRPVKVMGIDADFGTAYAKSPVRVPTLRACRCPGARSSRWPTATSGP